MEDRLKRLVEGNSEANRKGIALEWKRQGKKIMGVLCSYVPEEVIYAAGMLPWRVTGTWRESAPMASVYRPGNCCLYCTHVLESLLSGELDFLDGVIGTNRDDDLRRLWDVWTDVGKTAFTHIMNVPYQDSERAYRELAKEIRVLLEVVGRFRGVSISEESLRQAISVYNKTRTLVMKLYELRKKDVPPLSGAEVLGITTTASIMPRDQFNQELEALLPYLEGRRTPLSSVHPRLLVSSDMLDNPAYLELIEEAGCIVAMDDLDTGSRHFWHTVDSSLADPAYALAKRYITRPPCSRMYAWDVAVQQVVEWAKEFNIDGVVDLPQMNCTTRAFRAPYFRDKLTEAGIPSMSFKREYHLASAGQLRTRIGAFVEMLDSEA